MKARLLLFAIVLTGLVTSCNEYYDDMEALGKRVKVLEDSTLVITSTLEDLQLLEQAMLAHGYITDVIDNNDGTCTIHLRGYFNSSNVLTDSVVTLQGGMNGQRGKDGQTADMMLGVIEGTDGNFYWTFGGDPLRDDEGKPIPVRGPDGKNGLNGEDGQNGENGKDVDPNLPLPQVRIGVKGTWEISRDGGESWTDTGVSANGKDGTNGKDGDKGKKGEEGKPDSVIVSITDTGSTWTFVVHISPSGKETTLVIPKE